MLNSAIMTSRFISSVLVLLCVEYSGVLLSVLADLVSGVRRARREGQSCTSRGLRRSVAKLSSYFLSLFCLTVVDGMIVAAIITLPSLGKSFLPPFPYLTTVGAVSLVLIEAKSIAENSPHRARLAEALHVFMSILRKGRRV